MTDGRRTRLILESLVIVGSILLAFSIDAWWDREQEGERVDALVQLLRADIEEEIADLRFSNARADSILGILGEISRISGKATPVPEQDSLARLAGAVFSASSFSPSIAAYEVARGSTAWDRLPAAVNALLAEYLEGYPTFDNQIQVLAVANLVEVSSRYGGPSALGAGLDGSSLEADYAGFITDPEFLAWLWVHRTVMSGERSWRVDWIDGLERVLQDLEEF